MGTSNATTARRSFLVLALICLALVAMVVQPFAYALLLAGILAGALDPLYEKLARRLGNRRKIAAALATLALLSLVLMPLAFFATVAVQQGIDGYNYVRQTLDSRGLSGLTDHFPDSLRTLGERITASLPRGDELAAALSGPGSKAFLVVGSMVITGAQALLQTLLMLIAFFFLLTDGKVLVAWLDDVVPLKRGQFIEILGEFRKVAGTLMLSLIASGGAQAALALGGYLVAGVPRPFFFALLTFFLSFVPGFGGSGTVVILAGTLFLRGHPLAGALLAAWGILAVGLIDNVVKPLFIRAGIELHAAVVFFALLGGIAFFGPAGLLIGPLTAALALTLVRIYRRDFPG